MALRSSAEILRAKPTAELDVRERTFLDEASTYEFRSIVGEVATKSNQDDTEP
jgi:hypothetical protein